MSGVRLDKRCKGSHRHSVAGYGGGRKLSYINVINTNMFTRRLGKRIFCDNKAEEIPALYLHYDTNTVQSSAQMMKEWCVGMINNQNNIKGLE